MVDPRRLTHEDIEGAIVFDGVLDFVNNTHVAVTSQRDYWDEVAHECEKRGDEMGELEARRRAHALDLTLDGLRLIIAAIEPKL